MEYLSKKDDVKQTNFLSCIATYIHRCLDTHIAEATSHSHRPTVR